ncbi:hypothetical protein AU255_01050 [Methyloprofundus sedimenti]|uniref:Uncharacterized protein n=1 Tax=Methyloprofundus sedimenti TaxID=1420851 RepID=A0A1V8MAL9_9GAMM|nr:hypothetical protein [Methyloprofundus sedimenti]OQK18644.1 hypothetical protein AU255_01050 [Methyloprofundus sedimenti]
MKNNELKITENTLDIACDYVTKQFAAHSWWPKEQPDLAKQEFALMRGNAVAFNVWCERWLDAGQCRQLKAAIKKSI